MSGDPPAEDSPVVRVLVVGAVCGLSLVFGVSALAGYLADRIRRR